MTPLGDNEGLKRLTGSEIDADLLYDLGQECYIVPKLDLSIYAMDHSSAREWPKMVTELFDGADLVAEGLEHLAIALQPEPATSAE